MPNDGPWRYCRYAWHNVGPVGSMMSQGDDAYIRCNVVATQEDGLCDDHRYVVARGSEWRTPAYVEAEVLSPELATRVRPLILGDLDEAVDGDV